MGVTPSPTGVTVNYYDAAGNLTETFQAPYAVFTTRRQLEADANSSGDWLKQVYVAERPAGLNGLIATHPLTAEEPPGTSRSSRSVDVLKSRDSGVAIAAGQAVMAECETVSVGGQEFFFATKLHVSPVVPEDDHPLVDIWRDGILQAP